MLKKLIPVIILTLATINCGGGMYTSGNSERDDSYTVPWGNVTITKDAFIFGGDYPSDIIIPDVDGMRDTAFVVSFMAPAGVLAIDLKSDPLKLSTKFKGIISPSGTGMPNTLFVISEARAFMLTSSHVVDFNPTTGGVHKTINLLSKHYLSTPKPISSQYDVDGDGSLDSQVQTIDLNFPAGIVASGNKLFITMSNLISPLSPAIAAPGLVKIFNIQDSAPYLTESYETVITTDFNPTALTLLPDGLIAVTNSGVSDIWDGAAHPLTNSSIDFLDPESASIVANVSLGNAALSFQDMAVTSDGSMAYVGSASYGEVYAIDLLAKKAVFTHANPITITGNDEGSGYLSSIALSYDNWYLFVANFDDSSIYPVDVKANPPQVLPTTFNNPFVLGFGKGVTPENPTGANTGVGSLVVRSGTPGVDYSGPDIYALTGTPGTLVTINTHGNAEGNQLQIKNMEIVPNQIETSTTGSTIQLHLRLKYSNSEVESDVTDTFVNPYSGYPVSVKWSSSNPNVATVNNSAMITVKSTGETVVSARIGQSSAEATLIVEAETVTDNSANDPPPEDPGDDNGGGGSSWPWGYPDPNILITPYTIQELDILTIRYRIDPRLFDPDPDPEPDPTEPEILTEAPAGTDPFADEVIEFNAGPGAGFGQSYFPNIVLGPPQGSAAGSGGMDVLSLGEGGEIILEMTDFIIADGDGPDFTVFENVFFIAGNPDKPFSEPALVSVSEDGINYYEFPCDLDDSPHYPGCAGTYPTFSHPDNGIDPTDPDVSGGNQFDLADVGLTTARFIKITDDGVSTVGGGSSAGFDLDAIAIINGALPE